MQEYLAMKHVSEPSDMDVEQKFDSELKNIASDKESDANMKMNQLQTLMGSYITKLHEQSEKKNNNRASTTSPEVNIDQGPDITEPLSKENGSEADKTIKMNPQTQNEMWNKDIEPDQVLGPEKSEKVNKNETKKKSKKNPPVPTRKQPIRRAKLLMRPVSEIRKGWLKI